MKELDPNDRKRLQVAVGSLIVIALIITYLAISGHLASMCSQMMQVFEIGTHSGAMWKVGGTLAPLAFIMIQILPGFNSSDTWRIYRSGRRIHLRGVAECDFIRK